MFYDDEGVRNQRPTNVAYYQRNRAREIARVKRRQAATRDFLRHYRSQPCADCGKTFLAHQMDLDHRDPAAKTFRLTAGRAMLMSRERIRHELGKCDVVCANCHRLRTGERQRRSQASRRTAPPSRELYRKRRYWREQARLLERLKQRPCADCGLSFSSCAMDFDHRDSNTKRYTISRMIGRAGTARILAEVAKCDIVCANCHRDRTYRRREGSHSERE